MKRAKLCPSMMCADIIRLPEYLDIFRREGIDYLHIDVMDGCFVPNLQLGTDYIRQLRRHSDIPLDVHLMIERPDDKLEWFDLRPGDCASVHCESTPHIHRAVAGIARTGATPILALNPGTPLGAADEVLADIGAVLLMTVNPGFAGQVMIPSMPDKIRRLRQKLDAAGYPDMGIEVDGNVSFSNAEKMAAAGADMFVAGTASIFTDAMPPDQAIRRLRQCITESVE